MNRAGNFAILILVVINIALWLLFPPLDTAHRYAEALTKLAALRPAVDAFFDHVLVMAEDVRIRANRLALLAALQRLFLLMANLSRLPG